MKISNFEYWSNFKQSKIGHHFRKIDVTKKGQLEKCAPRFVFLNEKNLKQIQMAFDIRN